MAKAVFQRNQKVWVESVGAWSVVERIVPVWARGFEEPVRITYDVGLGREFQAHELTAEQANGDVLDEGGSRWRRTTPATTGSPTPLRPASRSRCRP